jgi:hypothetical protein
MENKNTRHADVADDLARVYGLHVWSVERTGKGKNSQVYRVVSGDNTAFIVKYYFRDKLDSRDRLKVEFSSLTFLWKNGVRCIPEPIMADERSGSAVYSYVAGERPSMEDISNEDIAFAVDFLSTLKDLRVSAGVKDMPIASEACFSFQELLDNIDLRYRRLLDGTVNVAHDGFHEFIKKDFVSALAVISDWCRGKFRERSISPDCLAVEGRTLSPSDFGFHNSIRNESGKLFFLDFEYFGWDDPVKTVSDFILHPAMGLAAERKKVFYAAMLDRFKEYRDLAERVEIYYPLYALKWCMIFLNEFLPDQMSRRRFAGCVEEEETKILDDQLMKSKNMLKDITKEYKRFPYNH